jgi:hypothetical protein
MRRSPPDVHTIQREGQLIRSGSRPGGDAFLVPGPLEALTEARSVSFELVLQTEARAGRWDRERLTRCRTFSEKSPSIRAMRGLV